MTASPTRKLSHQLGLTLSTITAFSLAVGSRPANAASLGGYTWNQANAVTSGAIISGQENTSAFDAVFPTNEATTVARVLGYAAPNTSIDLGNDTNRSIIELGWGGSLLSNKSGKDLVVYESGGSTRPEAFAVAVRRRGETSFSNFLYKFSDSYTADSFVFATAFDLSDFGLGEGDAIDAIRISNLINTDQVSNSNGEGFLGGQYNPQTGSQGTGNFGTGQYDADITYVVGLHDVAAPPARTSTRTVPEPTGALSLLALGVFGIAGVLKRKAQQEL